jgi:hypothetical protein
MVPKVYRMIDLPNIMTNAAIVATTEVMGMTVSGPKYAKKMAKVCMANASLHLRNENEPRPVRWSEYRAQSARGAPVCGDMSRTS